MKPRLAILLVLVAALGLPGCSGVSGLDEEQPVLPPSDQARVRSQSERAFEEGAWAVAWDEAVRSAAPQEKLETIAIEAMAPRDPVRTPASPGPAASMFDALRAKYGRLTPAARAQVTERSRAYGEANRWTEAVELELVAADDPPEFAGAWTVYAAAPVWKVTALRELIEDAREAHAEKLAEAAQGSDG